MNETDTLCINCNEPDTLVLKECQRARHYTGERIPRCNTGSGCLACWAVYHRRHAHRNDFIACGLCASSTSVVATAAAELSGPSAVRGDVERGIAKGETGNKEYREFTFAD